MKNFLILFFLFIGTQFICKAQTNYDPTLAKQLGADDYGMKKYVNAFLYRGDQSGDFRTKKRLNFKQVIWQILTN
jgi:uncharacterized protein